MFRTFEPTQWRIACELLGLITCAKRPLRLHEIRAARSIDILTQKFDFMDERRRSEIQVNCGPLIEVLPGERVELVHTTAKM